MRSSTQGEDQEWWPRSREELGVSIDLEVGLFDWTVVMETQGLNNLQKEQRPFYSDSYHFDPGRDVVMNLSVLGSPWRVSSRGWGDVL